MKKLLSVFVMLTLLTAYSRVVAQQEFKITPVSSIGYLQYLPKGYNQSSKNYAVLIFLHGIGERGPNTSQPAALKSASKKLLKHGPPKHIAHGTDFPFIVISPQLQSRFKTWPVWYVMEVINYVKQTLRIDEDRIYLTGLSLGGGGAWTVAEENPGLFAAVAPVCGGYNSPAKAKGIANHNLPVWAFHGDRDPIVPVSRSARMVDAINSYRPNEKAKLSVYKGVRHEAWDNAYQPNHSVHSQNMYEWMMQFSRHGQSPERGPNAAPTADAGKDAQISVSQSALLLQGNGADKDGKITAFQWQKISGPKVDMQGANSKELRLTKFAPGKYVFSLTVTDDKGTTAADEVNVIVSDSPAPITTVSAGPDVQTTKSAVLIKGSADVKNGTIKLYAWTQIEGPGAKLTGSATPELKVDGLKRGKYVFRFSVTDDKQNTKFDDMTLTVKNKAKNKNRPVANAGNDKYLTYPVQFVHLHGSAYSPGGRIVSQHWVQVSGKRTRIHHNKSFNPVITNITSPGKRTYKLVVKDDRGMVTVDHIRLIIKANETKVASQDSVIVMDDPGMPGDSLNDVESTFDLNSGVDWDAAYTVLIYNERGEKLFQGPWTANSYTESFGHPGFYIFQVWTGRKRVYTGKLIVR